MEESGRLRGENVKFFTPLYRFVVERSAKYKSRQQNSLQTFKQGKSR